jgi:hypothetical protein
MTNSTAPDLVAQMRAIASEQGWTDATFLAVLLDVIEADPAAASRAHAACLAIAEGDASAPAEPGEAYEDFEAAYGAIRPEEGAGAFTFEQVRHSDPHHVWSVVEGDDGNLWLLPGFRTVNALGEYVRSERPWHDDALAFRWDA